MRRILCKSKEQLTQKCRYNASWWRQVMSRMAFRSQEQKEKEKEYEQILESLREQKEDMQRVEEVMQEIKLEMEQVVTTSLTNHHVQSLFHSQPFSHALQMATLNFIGSLAAPRNKQLSTQFLELAYKKACNEKEKQEVEYIRLYLEKVESIEIGDEERFEQINKELVELGEQGQPQAALIVGKELYTTSGQMVQQKYKKDRKIMKHKAYELFTSSAQQLHWPAFYYLGLMALNGDTPTGIDTQQAYQCFLIAASKGSPMAYFQLAQMYKQGELGIVEAMHNLGVMYQEGTIVEIDSLKAAAWFNRAATLGFTHSAYNCAKLFMQGAQDNKLQVDYRAAISYLELCQQDNQFPADVSPLIQQCINRIEQESQQTPFTYT